MKIKKIIAAISGASGSIYGIRILQFLLQNPIHVHLVISKAGHKVLCHETDYRGEPFNVFLKNINTVFHENANLKIYDEDDFFAPFASGSFRHDGMVIAPCSMKTLASISSGIADNLIQRAADVCLKEKYPLILITRETPLNLIHLKNMYDAALAGATIMPPCPGFYSNPETVDDLVNCFIARVLDQFKIKHNMKAWAV